MAATFWLGKWYQSLRLITVLSAKHEHNPVSCSYGTALASHTVIHIVEVFVGIARVVDDQRST